jgi:hypothetical protein
MAIPTKGGIAFRNWAFWYISSPISHPMSTISVLRSDDVVVSFVAGGGGGGAGCLHACRHLNSFFEWAFGFVLIW